MQTHLSRRSTTLGQRPRVLTRHLCMESGSVAAAWLRRPLWQERSWVADLKTSWLSRIRRRHGPSSTALSLIRFTQEETLDEFLGSW